VQTGSVLSTWTVGNHVLTAAEVAAGAPQRPPFVDDDGAPVDPDEVTVALTAPTGEQWTFRYPTPGPADSGGLDHPETGRFSVAWTPAASEDGLWRWFLKGAMTLGTGWTDQDVFYVRRPVAALP
jgi:hypothetical protein